MTIWSTPQKLFDKLNAEFQFTMDACAERENAKCTHFWTREESLMFPWDGTVWLNPPYGREIGQWMQKALSVSRDGHTVVALVPVRSNAPWWHESVMHADEIRFVRKKLAYDSNDGKRGVPFWPSAVIVFGLKRQTPIVTTYEQ